MRSPRRASRGRPRCSMRDSSSGPGSTPAAASAAPISARGCFPPTIRRRPWRWLRSSTPSTPRARRSGARGHGSRHRLHRDPEQRGRRAHAAGRSARRLRHPGVIGIVAGRLRERYRKPVIVVGVDRAANVGKGSGRSQPGVNLGRAVQAAFDEGLILAGGGHAMCPAGLSVRPWTRSPSCAPSCASAPERRRARSWPRPWRMAWTTDALVTARGADRALWQDFQRMAPFGPGNVEPLFAAADVRVERPMALRGGHVRCTLTDGSGGKLKAVAWRVEGSETGSPAAPRRAAPDPRRGSSEAGRLAGPRGRGIRDRGRRRSPADLGAV